MKQSSKTKRNGSHPAIRKTPTGIAGFDQITGGGIPHGRTTLVCGSAGCGKTIMAMEYLIRGARDYGEPGLFISFEESDAELVENFEVLGFGLSDLIAANKLAIDFIPIDRNDFEESGEYDLDGLFIRLDFAIQAIGAKRVVLDTAETLLGGLPNESIVRSELVRLFRWLKDRGVTTVVTGERGAGQLTRHGLEEYVSDCVVLLDHRVDGQISTRRLRVVKYRGTAHGANEYPFVIDAGGFSVLPVTSLELDHKIYNERVSSGIPRLDLMLDGGLFRGSSVLVSGTAGTGKSTIGAHFAHATCARGERALYFSFEESVDQICRNMSSIGLDLRASIKRGLLVVKSTRPTFLGLEQHLVNMHRLIEEVDPSAVVVDPISSMVAAGSVEQAGAMLLRMVDFLKARGITFVMTYLTQGGERLEATELTLSSLMDTWILLRDIELGGERNRGLYVLKSRGSNHSNQIREFRMSPKGIHILDVYSGPGGVLTGSARLAQEADEAEAERSRRLETLKRSRALERKRRILQAEIEKLKAEFEFDAEEAGLIAREDSETESLKGDVVRRMATSRRAESPSSGPAPRKTGRKVKQHGR